MRAVQILADLIVASGRLRVMIRQGTASSDSDRRMSIRLYESAWVQAEGIEAPLNVRKSRQNAGHFHVGDYLYDVDGRPIARDGIPPRLTAVLSLQAVKEAGLNSDYHR